MHWLEKFRREYIGPDGKKGISKNELAAMIKLKYGKCTATVIDNIELGCIVHPNIADAVARLTGATAQQYDSMVHPQHRGRRGTPKPEKKAKPEKPQKAAKNKRGSPRPVVAIDKAGNEAARYDSGFQAAMAAGRSDAMIYKRCARRLAPGAYEFNKSDITWRYADEWDNMSESARRADIENANKDNTKEREEDAGKDGHGAISSACTANQPG